MKKIYILMLLCIFSVSVFGQWIKNEEPVLENGASGTWDAELVGFPSVVLIDDTYHMWYAGMGTNVLRIGHATSSNGISWVKDENNPVLDVGETGSWEGSRVYLPSVVYDGAIFHMWYTGEGETGNGKLGYATSENGVAWTKHEGKPYFELEGEPYNGEVFAGAILFEGDTFHMWYTQRAENIDFHAMGYASSVNGADWDLYANNPVMIGGESGAWDRPRLQPSSVVKVDNDYHLCYSGGEYSEWRLGLATSSDGITWTKNPQNPVIDVGSDGLWDDKFVSFASLIYDSDSSKLKMWYYGSDADYSGDIGYAELDIIIDVQTYNRSELTIYPNPASNILNLRSEVKGEQFIEIFSVNGQIVFSGIMEGDEMQIDLSEWSTGIYMLKQQSGSFIKTVKLIKL